MAKKGQEKIKLEVEKRKITGRKVKKLRQEGILPANIYGKKVKSLAVQLDLKSFLPVFKEVKETGLVDLKVKDEPQTRTVLIHNVQFHPVSDQPLHADFFQVDLTKKITTEIPIELAGESIAVKEKGGVLIQPLTEVEIEALPTDLPESFVVSLEQLKEIGDIIRVGDLKAPKGVSILTPAGEVLVKIEAPTKEEEVAPPAAEAVPAEGEKEAEVEGEKPAEETGKAGEKPAEEKKPAPDKEQKQENGKK